MANPLPTEYVEQYIYQYVGYVKQKSNGKYIGGCPICREGDSWGKKARFGWNPEKHSVNCFNCGYSNSEIGLIADLTGMTFSEIWKETEEYDVIPQDLNNYIKTATSTVAKTETLPENSINLGDPLQLEFYKDNDIVNLALKYIKERKLWDAPNKPKTFYISLSDYTHKNRLIIPYYDGGKIVWYQTRRLIEDDSAKYLSKANSERSLFNIDNINPDIPYIFVFEGAIDSMFVENGTCVSGITEEGDFVLTERQKDQFRRFPLHERIWVLDSPYLDDAAKNKTEQLFTKGEKVFQWPRNIGEKCKDFNDIIMKSSKTKIPYEFITGNLKKKNNLGNIVKYLLDRQKGD